MNDIYNDKRLSIKISEDLYGKLAKIPHGLKSLVFRYLAEDVARLVEQDGERFLGAVANRCVMAEHVLLVPYEKKRQEEEDGNDNKP